MSRFFIRICMFCLLLALGSFVLVACNDSDSDTAYSSAYDDALISTDFATKKVAIIVQSTGAWKLWKGTSATDFDLNAAPLIETTGAGVFEVDNSDTRSYYYFQNEHGGAILADRFLPLEVLQNARDLGGFQGADGKHVAYGKIVRTEALRNMANSAFDNQFLSDMGATYVFDFRMPAEVDGMPQYGIAASPSYAPPSVPAQNLINVPITPPSDTTNWGGSRETDGFYRDMYIGVLFDPATGGQAAYKQLFEALMRDEGLVIYHCSSGKDRGGMASALILSALGVSEEDVYEDYMATSSVASINGQTQAIERKGDAKVRPTWIKTAFAEMKARHGSVENYLRDVLGVDIEAFRELYLY